MGNGEDFDDRTRVAGTGAREAHVGDVIKGRFELLELLGEGGMGKVFKALDRVRRDAQDREPYAALKVLSSTFGRHEASTIALQREAKKALALTHLNIIRVYDFDRDDGMVFMTMELLSGQSLGSVIRAPGFSGMPLQRAMQIIKPAAAALGHAHEAGFVHSDLKPSNVFLTKTGHVKVIDLGIARALKRADADADHTVFDPAQLHALTPPYACPEQIEGQEPDPRDDVYSLACVTYELLTGRHPFGRISSAKAMAEGLQPARPPGLNRMQWQALARGLALRREVRTPGVAQFIQNLAREPERGGKARVLLLAGGTLSLVAAAGVALWLLWPEMIPEFGVLGKRIPAVQEPTSLQAESEERPSTAHNSVEPSGARVREETSAVASLEMIESTARALPCTLLQSSVSQGLVRLQGHARSEADLALVTGRLKELPGITGVLPSVSVLKDAYCLEIDIARPFVFANWTAGSPFAIRPSKRTFVQGDALMADVVAGDRDGFAYVDYYDAYGSVVHMLPRPKAPDNYLRAGERLTLGTGGRLGEWVVGPPYGRDLVIAIKTPEPLYQHPRQREIEPAADYLPDLRERLMRLTERYSTGAVLADYTLITTQPK